VDEQCGRESYRPFIEQTQGENMSLLQKTIAELRELKHEEIDLVGGGPAGPTSEFTYCPSYSYITTPYGSSQQQDDGSGDAGNDWGNV
jgi:hypothetical protein